MNLIEEIYSLYLKSRKVFTDSRNAKEGGIFVALKGDRFDANDFALKAIADGADYAIVDRTDLKGAEKCIWVPDVLKTLQDLANYHRKQLTIPVLGITGTNGKTTTKELIAAVLSQKYNVLATQGNLNNHIGVPLTLLSITDKHEFAVIEMGANHPGEIDFLCNIAEPDYGIITNVGKAHLEGFGSFEGVKQTKSELYRHIERKGKGIFINVDNAHLKELSVNNGVKFTYAIKDESADLFGSLANDDVFVVAKMWFQQGWLYIQSKLSGEYNLENMLAAARIGLQFGVDPLLIKKGIEAYVPSNKRSQISQIGDVTVLLDCYNANPSSMSLSVLNFRNINKENKLLILGDMLELGEVSKAEHQKIVDSLVEYGFDDVILVGKEFMAVNSPSSYKLYQSVDQLNDTISPDYFDGKFVLIKGSRGIKLEKVLDIIKK